MPHTPLKICGLTRADDVDAAVALGVDALGFVFYPPSPRHLTASQAAKLVRRVPPLISTVGLFVNAQPETVHSICQEVPLAILQFHGDESPSYCAQFARPFIKAIRMTPGTDLLESARIFSRARALLLDTFTPAYGGSGHFFDWTWIPKNMPMPFILSGGLTAANVAQAIHQVRPAAVDVSSGVEREKGIKDPLQMAAFVTAVRNAT